MTLGCGKEKETCAGKRPRSHDPTWGDSSSDGVPCVDAAGNRHPRSERTLNKNARRRPPEAQARNAEMERARKKRLREGKLKEEEQRLVKQKREEREAPDGKAEEPQLTGAPPGTTAQEESTQPNLTRGGGYDTTNNMNLFLTQCCGCSNPVRNKKTLFDALIQQITTLEEHGVLDNHRDVQVAGHLVVGVLRLVRKELEGKDPHVSKARGPLAGHNSHARPALATAHVATAPVATPWPRPPPPPRSPPPQSPLPGSPPPRPQGPRRPPRRPPPRRPRAAMPPCRHDPPWPPPPRPTTAPITAPAMAITAMPLPRPLILPPDNAPDIAPAATAATARTGLQPSSRPPPIITHHPPPTTTTAAHHPQPPTP